MEPIGLLPHSKQLYDCPCPELYQSSPLNPILSCKDPT
jgi:hypothetical protein